jgi:GTPase involved in cell partitioning and DNA repair
MGKSKIFQSNDKITLHMSRDDLSYTIHELQKLHEEGGQFSLRLENDDSFLIFQKVQVDENNNTEVINQGTTDSIWSSVVFFFVCIFCFISVLYGLFQFLS